jgi:hypothetical protein
MVARASCRRLLRITPMIRRVSLPLRGLIELCQTVSDSGGLPIHLQRSAISQSEIPESQAGNEGSCG